MRLPLLQRTALFAGLLAFSVCVCMGAIAALAFEWQEQSLLHNALQAGVDEMRAHVDAGGWPDLNNGENVVSALAPVADLRAIPESLRPLAIGQIEIEQGAFAQFEVLVQEHSGYRYVYGVSIANSEREEQDFVWIALFLFACAVAISALLGWLFARQLTKPMHSLVNAISNIDDLPAGAPLTLQGQDETDQIVLAFNRYRYALHAASTNEAEFLADVAHALRTPVAVIQSGLELLAPSIAAKQKDVFARVQSHSAQMGLQLQALLLSAQKIERDATELVDVLQEVELALRFLKTRGSTCFSLNIASGVSISVRRAVLRWVVVQCANAMQTQQLVEISWHRQALSFAGDDAAHDILLPELAASVCRREGWHLEVVAATLKLAL
jgi:signal transduction histidine kinase